MCVGGALGTCCGQMLEKPRSGCWGQFLVGVGDPSPEGGKGQQAECALEEGLGWRWGWAWVPAVRDWRLPQGQRKELLGPTGKGSRPRMEENELYSSTTAGEGLSPLQPPQGYGGVGLWWLRLSLPALWLSPAPASPGQPPYQPLCIASGRVPGWGSLARPELTPPCPGPCCWGAGQAGGGGESVKVLLFFCVFQCLQCLPLSGKRMVLFPWI